MRFIYGPFYLERFFPTQTSASNMLFVYNECATDNLRALQLTSPMIIKNIKAVGLGKSDDFTLCVLYIFLLIFFQGLGDGNGGFTKGKI